MRNKLIFSLLLCTSVQLSFAFSKLDEGTEKIPNSKESTERTITIEGNDFILDGKKIQIISGSLHYFRTPAETWTDRLRMLKYAGLNAVSTYVEWSFHEPEERMYDFSGDRNLTEFIRLAEEEDLLVLLRPGPYICAERDLGGIPYWLLGKYPTINLRTTDPDFLEESKTWLDRLFKEVKHQLYGNGGPIILVQVENEYGSYGNDTYYKIAIRDMISAHVNDAALLYTTDGLYPHYLNGQVEGVLCTVDFGAGQNVDYIFKRYRDNFTSGPLMNSEFYPGWLSHWGEQFPRVDSEKVVKTLVDILSYPASVNIYVFFGGTNFEFTSGANFGTSYEPDITSYDYDAPLTEAGDPTPKYFAIRSAIEIFRPEVAKLPKPEPKPKGNYGVVEVTAEASILSPEGRRALGKKYQTFRGGLLPTFESLRQRAGLVLYETVINSPEIMSSTLIIKKPADLIYVFVNERYGGKLSRRDHDLMLRLTLKPNAKLSLLVENMGRINYGPLLHDFKGILSPVKLGDFTLLGPWNITGFPLENVNVSINGPFYGNGPTMFKGTFVLPDKHPKDTFLDTTGWSKGYVWINGRNLGRYWPALGPQKTLFVPGVWLQPPPLENTLQILELEKPAPERLMNFINYPILDGRSSS